MVFAVLCHTSQIELGREAIVDRLGRSPAQNLLFCLVQRKLSAAESC